MAIEIKIKPEAERYVRAVVQECTGEVGGLGYLTRDDDGNFVIYKFVVLPQEASSGGVDFDDDGLHAELIRAMDDGEINNQRVSWHSHGTMNTFYSNTDEEAIEKYRQGGAPYLISLVYNRKGEVNPRLDIWDSEAVGSIVFSKDSIEYTVMKDPNRDPITLKAAADVKANVRTATYGNWWSNRSMSRKEADKEGVCWWCEGEGRRTAYDMKVREPVFGECHDCDGTGLNTKEYNKAKKAGKLSQAKSAATRKYNKRVEAEKKEDDSPLRITTSTSDNGSDGWAGKSIDEMTEREFDDMCEAFNINPDWLRDADGYVYNDIEVEDVKLLSPGDEDWGKGGSD